MIVMRTSPIDKVPPSSSGLRPGSGKDKGFIGDMTNIMSGIMGSRQKLTDKAIPSMQGQKKKAKHTFWEQIGPTGGGPQVPEVIPSYNGDVTAAIWRGQVNFTYYYLIVRLCLDKFNLII